MSAYDEPLPTCRRCGRMATGWPAHRADVCSSRDWQTCLREPRTVAAENTERSTR